MELKCFFLRTSRCGANSAYEQEYSENSAIRGTSAGLDSPDSMDAD